MLKVSVKDFGPVIEGTVDLKPLTLFVGPSNAGKSYLAMLVYSLMQSPDDTPSADPLNYVYFEPEGRGLRAAQTSGGNIDEEIFKAIGQLGSQYRNQS